MSTLLYCVFRTPSGPVQLPAGIDERPVRLIASSGLSAAASSVASSSLEPNLERALAHERVVEACFERRTVVPMRFGSILPGDASVERFLAAHARQFKASLRALSGCVELGVRLRSPPRPSASRVKRKVGAGRAYLEARAGGSDATNAIGEERATLLARYRRGLRGLFEQIELSADVSGTSIAFLVPRAHVESFRRRFARLREPAATPLTGPWPPFSFVGSTREPPDVLISPGAGSSPGRD